jgi:DNA-binding NarL/FixJ family response regulator
MRPHYIIDSSTGCWVWCGALDKDGYGVWSTRQKGVSSRVARRLYEQHKGIIPRGLVLDHFFCQNKACVNPDHVEPVTYAENTYRCSLRKLTKEQVITIHALLEQGEKQYKIAKMFGVNQSTVSRIHTQQRRKQG